MLAGGGMGVCLDFSFAYYFSLSFSLSSGDGSIENEIDILSERAVKPKTTSTNLAAMLYQIQ